MWSNPGYSVSPSSQQPGASEIVTREVAAPTPGSAVMPPQPTPAAQHPTALAPSSPTQPALGSGGGSGLMDGAFDVPPTLVERIELCKFLAAANLLPSALQDQPANVLLIMHKALALGIPLSVAIEHMHIIDGKVGHSAELLRALLYRHGHTLRWPTMTDREVVGELVLRHDPHNPRTEKFTIADATRMELLTKSNWRKDPVSMLVARATTRLISRHCPEVAVALGNLSAMDIESEPPEPGGEPVRATAEAVDRTEQQAAALYAEALEAADSSALQDIGRRARTANLLEVPVDGDTSLQAALLRRIDELHTAPPEPDEQAPPQDRPKRGTRR